MCNYFFPPLIYCNVWIPHPISWMFTFFSSYSDDFFCVYLSVYTVKSSNSVMGFLISHWLKFVGKWYNIPVKSMKKTNHPTVQCNYSVWFTYNKRHFECSYAGLSDDSCSGTWDESTSGERICVGAMSIQAKLTALLCKKNTIKQRW